MVKVEQATPVHIFPQLKGREILVEAAIAADVVREVERLAPTRAFDPLHHQGKGSGILDLRTGAFPLAYLPYSVGLAFCVGLVQNSATNAGLGLTIRADGRLGIAWPISSSEHVPMRAYFSLSLVFVLAGFAPLAQAAPPHPEPRVIVNVLSVEGPHPRAGVERSLRLGWNRIVRCYKSRGGRSKGKVDLKLDLSSQGEVKKASATGSTLNDTELTSCLVSVVRELSVPRAETDSRAVAEIKLAPGDRT